MFRYTLEDLSESGRTDFTSLNFEESNGQSEVFQVELEKGVTRR